MDELKIVAKEALDSFEAIADAAGLQLQSRGLSLDSLAVINHATAEKTSREMQSRNEERASDSIHLRREPAIARLVLVDEHEHRETIYISPVSTVNAAGVHMCSYMSPKGRLASLPVGDGTDIPLPGGKRWFEVEAKLTFKPAQDGDGWDARPAVQFRDQQPPLTIKSLRELLREDGVSDNDIDVLEQWFVEDGPDGGENVFEGIRRETLTAMELRVAPILDKFQDHIFRLPLDSQIAVLGPPGTGKTTTLVKRMRQKLDFAFLDEDERLLVEEPDAAGLSHPDSWIMFAPTELLCDYVKEAFGKEGVPVHDERLHTWEYHRRQIGRNDLAILNRGSGGGLYIKDEPTLLASDTLTNQIAWFEAFNAFQQDAFMQQLTVEAERLRDANDPRQAALGQRVLAAVERGRDRPLQTLGEIAGFIKELRGIAKDLSPGIKSGLIAPIQAYAQSDSDFLDELLDFVSAQSTDDGDEADDDVDDDDEDEVEGRQTATGKRLAAEAFRKAMRARAIGQATGRSPGPKTRAGQLLAFLVARGLKLPELKVIGKRLIVQRAARRLSRAPTTWLSKISLRYRQFRRVMLAQQLFYGKAPGNAMEAHPAEIDLIILAMLQQVRAMESDAVLKSRLVEDRPPLMDAVARLRRNQILVDEATDFSPIEIAIMRNLTAPSTGALFISGDFNQRLTLVGSRSEEELTWAVPGIQIERINVSYRQSRKLTQFANELAGLQGLEVNEQAPDHLENIGFEPVLGTALGNSENTAKWLAARIREIGKITEGAMPTIAVLAPDEAILEPLASYLSTELEAMNIKAVACPKGKVKGMQGDVRLFDVQHIKGLEFEAVFFVDVDRLAEAKALLFDRYIYVGATRAATFLGLTCAGAELPATMAPLEVQMGTNWQEFTR